MNRAILLELKKRSILRLNSTLKIVLLLITFLLLTLDIYNYANKLWLSVPSSYYVFLNHIISLPVILILIKYNSSVLKKIKEDTKYKYDILLFINMLAVLPFILNFYYFEIKDFNSTSILIIFIFIFGIMLKLNSIRLFILNLYFFLIYYGMIYYFGISYEENVSIYVNGISALLIFSFLSRSIYKIAYKSIHNELLIKENNKILLKTQSELEQNLSLLNKQKNNLEISNANLKNFAQIAAHDIKTPLRTISNFTKILSSKYEGIIKDEDSIIQESIIDSCTELTLVTDGLLEFSKISNGSIALTTTVDLNELIPDVILLLNDSIIKKEPNITIQKNIPPVYGNRELLLQLFLNLLNNALKFSDLNRKPEIEIKHQIKNKEFITISITDNGIGIPEKQIKEVFQLFRTLHNSKKIEGNGIGLAISKSIVEKHEGEIWIKSELTKGSTFYFTLRINKSL